MGVTVHNLKGKNKPCSRKQNYKENNSPKSNTFRTAAEENCGKSIVMSASLPSGPLESLANLIVFGS